MLSIPVSIVKKSTQLFMVLGIFCSSVGWAQDEADLPEDDTEIDVAEDDSEVVEAPPEQQRESGFSVQEARVGFRGIGEAWSDPFIGSVYRSSRFFGAGALSYRFHKNFTVDVEAGFVRLDGNDGQSALQMIPFSLGGSVLFGSKNVEPFVGVGAGFIGFVEELPTAPVAGTKLGWDLRAGVRVGTRFIRSSQHSNVSQGAKQMDLEFMLGKRIHHVFNVGEGFDLGAFRAGIGFILRL